MDHVPFGHWALRPSSPHCAMTGWMRRGSSNREVCDLYVKTQLAPTLGAIPTPWDNTRERLLAAAAVKIELPPSQHTLLAERKATIETHLEREGSPLRGLIRLFYQQGSVVIGATISAKCRNAIVTSGGQPATGACLHRSCSVASGLEVAAPGRTIGENLKVIATYILYCLIAAKQNRTLLYVESPCCAGDVFTDRWPESQSD